LDNARGIDIAPPYPPTQITNLKRQTISFEQPMLVETASKQSVKAKQPENGQDFPNLFCPLKHCALDRRKNFA
jgi:hypothetical protein